MKKIIFIILCIPFLSCKGQNKDVEKEYVKLLEEITFKREVFLQKYNTSKPIKKEAVIIEAREYLVKKMAT